MPHDLFATSVPRRKKHLLAPKLAQHLLKYQPSGQKLTALSTCRDHCIHPVLGADMRGGMVFFTTVNPALNRPRWRTNDAESPIVNGEFFLTNQKTSPLTCVFEDGRHPSPQPPRIHARWPVILMPRRRNHRIHPVLRADMRGGMGRPNDAPAAPVVDIHRNAIRSPN